MGFQAQLKTAEAAAKVAKAAAAPLSRSSSTIKATPAHLTDSESEQATAPLPTTATPSEHNAVDESEPDVSAQSELDDDVAVAAEKEAREPAQSKSRNKPVAKPVKGVKVKAAKATKVLPDIEEPADGAVSEEEALPTPKKATSAPAHKKRKADVLGDKSTNARGSARGDDLPANDGPGLKIKKAKKTGTASSKVSALALALGGGDDDSDDDGVPSKSKKAKKSKHRGADAAADDDLPKKATKKRTLLGPRKKFDWTSEVRGTTGRAPTFDIAADGLWNV